MHLQTNRLADRSTSGNTIFSIGCLMASYYRRFRCSASLGGAWFRCGGRYTVFYQNTVRRVGASLQPASLRMGEGRHPAPDRGRFGHVFVAAPRPIAGISGGCRWEGEWGRAPPFSVHCNAAPLWRVKENRSEYGLLLRTPVGIETGKNTVLRKDRGDLRYYGVWETRTRGSAVTPRTPIVMCGRNKIIPLSLTAAVRR